MIVLQSDTLTAHILPRGATLAGLWLNGHPRSLVLGFTDPLAFDAAAFYAGALVGPVANRVAQGKLEIGAQTFNMPRNDGPNCLHSGDGGLHDIDWHVSGQTQTNVTLTAYLPDAANGLPGIRHICAVYTVDNNSTLTLKITAYSNCDTVMNIAHHPYWSLDDSDDVSTHSLQIHAAHYLPVDAQNLPTGEIKSVLGSDYDFQEPRPIRVDRALDANLCIGSTRALTPKDIAILTGRDGIQLHIASTEPGLQVYNGRNLPVDGPRALPGQRIAPFAGIALEPQGWPDAPNQPHFPSIALLAGDVYQQQTSYRIVKVCN